MARVAVALFAVILLAASSMAEPPVIRVRWDRKVDFSRYQTYAWEEGVRAVSEVADRLIVEHVDAELGNAGIFKDELEPTLLVVYYASTKDEFQIQGGYRHDWQDERSVTVESYRAGTLVVDIVNVAENRIVWRASATATISSDDKKNRRLLEQALQKMFESFPPP